MKLFFSYFKNKKLLHEKNSIDNKQQQQKQKQTACALNEWKRL